MFVAEKVQLLLVISLTAEQYDKLSTSVTVVMAAAMTSP